MFLELYNKLTKEKGAAGIFLNDSDELKTLVFKEKDLEGEINTGIFLNKNKSDEKGEHISVISCKDIKFDATFDLYRVLNALNAKYENVTLYLEDSKICAASFYKGEDLSFLMKTISVNLTTLALAVKRAKEV